MVFAEETREVFTLTSIQHIRTYTETERTRFFFHLLEVTETTNEYTITGGKTIIGKIFSYQEKTGMSPAEIMKLPYIMFVLGMYDAPQIDYSSKDEKKKKPKPPKTIADEIALVTGALQ